MAKSNVLNAPFSGFVKNLPRKQEREREIKGKRNDASDHHGQRSLLIWTPGFRNNFQDDFQSKHSHRKHVHDVHEGVDLIVFAWQR
jgi:hypothetical protein